MYVYVVCFILTKRVGESRSGTQAESKIHIECVFQANIWTKRVGESISGTQAESKIQIECYHITMDPQI